MHSDNSVKSLVRVLTDARLVHCSCKHSSVYTFYLYRCQASASCYSTSNVTGETHRLFLHDNRAIFNQTKYEWHVTAGQSCDERKSSVCFRITSNHCPSDVPWNTDDRSTDIKFRATKHWFWVWLHDCRGRVASSNFRGQRTILHKMYTFDVHCQGLSSVKH
jgi:hypothetical protein